MVRGQQVPLVLAREILGLAAVTRPSWPKLLVVRAGGRPRRPGWSTRSRGPRNW